MTKNDQAITFDETSLWMVTTSVVSCYEWGELWALFVLTTIKKYIYS